MDTLKDLDLISCPKCGDRRGLQFTPVPNRGVCQAFCAKACRHIWYLDAAGEMTEGRA